MFSACCEVFESTLAMIDIHLFDKMRARYTAALNAAILWELS